MLFWYYSTTEKHNNESLTYFRVFNLIKSESTGIKSNILYVINYYSYL